ncbi:hypothetical protein K503DRAFT_263528 [Rhizopogon vinicolor AM-OR11-026]|uniref:Uncharacterized protein n=1 Tax=Rhizopogon vinicolor AM-OR11-026 TaxID=1314800 RepID=A0A1B7NDG2_9AGAM|nr:hypothetical protein K503DRAFT_263528 [Rhizopogon vinicolor AM-OR11-026]
MCSLISSSVYTLLRLICSTTTPSSLTLIPFHRSLLTLAQLPSPAIQFVCPMVERAAVSAARMSRCRACIPFANTPVPTSYHFPRFSANQIKIIEKQR